MPEKLSKYANFYDIFPKNLTKFPNFTCFFCSKNARILHKNCPKILVGHVPCLPCPPSPTPACTTDGDAHVHVISIVLDYCGQFQHLPSTDGQVRARPCTCSNGRLRTYSVDAALCPIHTADADATKLFCRVVVGGVNTIRN